MADPRRMPDAVVLAPTLGRLPPKLPRNWLDVDTGDEFAEDEAEAEKLASRDVVEVEGL